VFTENIAAPTSDIANYEHDFVCSGQLMGQLCITLGNEVNL
jgi:hypothetical protein